MQLTLAFAVPGHAPDNPECPFCPGKKEEKDWKTWKGDDNESKILRRVMNSPVKLTDSNNQLDARPKDGPANGRQPQDTRRPIYRSSKDGTFIYEHAVFGKYSDEAHHAISGNQILSGHRIESLILSSGRSGKVEKDSGYSVNNCANGVCLPSYPKKYRGPSAELRWGDKDEPGKAKPLDAATKKLAARAPMEAGKGQVHIGEHDHPGDPDDERIAPIHHKSYPQQARDYLTDLFAVAVFRWSRECLLCKTEDGGVKDPLPTPFRINASLDAVSARLIQHVRDVPPSQWEYFISEYAARLHYDLCQHPLSRHP